MHVGCGERLHRMSTLCRAVRPSETCAISWGGCVSRSRGLGGADGFIYPDLNIIVKRGQKCFTAYLCACFVSAVASWFHWSGMLRGISYYDDVRLYGHSHSGCKSATGRYHLWPIRD
eukprot:2077674-Prymnesium_polylepis.1